MIHGILYNIKSFYSSSVQPVTKGAAETVLQVHQHQSHVAISVETFDFINVYFTGVGIGLEKFSTVNITLLVAVTSEED